MSRYYHDVLLQVVVCYGASWLHGSRHFSAPTYVEGDTPLPGPILGNPFGDSTACYLAIREPQGVAPSTPSVLNQAFNPVHVIARLCGRCSAIYNVTPAGSSGLVDNTVSHIGGQNAVQCMQPIIAPIGKYL